MRWWESVPAKPGGQSPAGAKGAREGPVGEKTGRGWSGGREGKGAGGRGRGRELLCSGAIERVGLVGSRAARNLGWIVANLSGVSSNGEGVNRSLTLSDYQAAHAMVGIRAREAGSQSPVKGERAC